MSGQCSSCSTAPTGEKRSEREKNGCEWLNERIYYVWTNGSKCISLMWGAPCVLLGARRCNWTERRKIIWQKKNASTDVIPSCWVLHSRGDTRRIWCCPAPHAKCVLNNAQWVLDWFVIFKYSNFVFRWKRFWKKIVYSSEKLSLILHLDGSLSIRFLIDRRHWSTRNQSNCVCNAISHACP